MLYVISRGLAQGKKAGIVSALGIGAGTLVHTSVAAFGLAAILVSVPIPFEIIRYAGAAYLVSLSLRMLLSKSAGTSISRTSTNFANSWAVFRQGVMTNVLKSEGSLILHDFLASIR